MTVSPGTPKAIGDKEVVSLSPWEEVTGRLLRVEETEDQLIVHLATGVLVFDIGTTRSEIIREQLLGKDDYIVSILRTDSPTNPIRLDIRPCVGEEATS